MKKKETINWAERFRKDYNKYRLKGFKDDGFGNSVTDQQAKGLEDRYLDRWILVDHAYISKGKSKYARKLAEVISLCWSDGSRSGQPFKLQIDYVIDGKTDVHPTYEHDVLYIFGKTKPLEDKVAQIIAKIDKKDR